MESPAAGDSTPPTGQPNAGASASGRQHRTRRGDGASCATAALREVTSNLERQSGRAGPGAARAGPGGVEPEVGTTISRTDRGPVARRTAKEREWGESVRHWATGTRSRRELCYRLARCSGWARAPKD